MGERGTMDSSSALNSLTGLPTTSMVKGLLDRGVEHLHRPPPRLHLPAGAQASHCWLLISPVPRWCEYSPGIVAFWVISSLHLGHKTSINHPSSHQLQAPCSRQKWL